MSEFGQAWLAALDVNDLAELGRRLSLVAEPASAPTASATLLTPAEAAARANVNVETIRRAVRSDALRACRAGRAVRIDAEDLNAWLTGPRRSGRAQAQTRQLRRQSGRTPMADALQRLAS
jgi:excisionase family DNA binding protein